MTKQDMMKEFSNWSDAIRLAEGFNFDNVVEVVSADEVVEFVSTGVAVDVKLTAQFRMNDGSVVDFIAECDERGFVFGEEGWYVNVF